jgi:hypothetical protein
VSSASARSTASPPPSKNHPKHPAKPSSPATQHPAPSTRSARCQRHLASRARPRNSSYQLTWHCRVALHPRPRATRRPAKRGGRTTSSVRRVEAGWMITSRKARRKVLRRIMRPKRRRGACLRPQRRVVRREQARRRVGARRLCQMSRLRREMM